MTGGLLTPCLLGFAVALMLSLQPWRLQGFGLALLAFTALAIMSFASVPTDWASAVLMCSWLSVAFTAATVGLLRVLSIAPMLLVVINAGVWIGFSMALTAESSYAVTPVLIASLSFPLSFISRSHHALVSRIVASWLIAVSILILGLSAVTTPGYQPDHIE